MQYLEFGRTSHKSSRVLFGGAAFMDVSQETADKVLDLLLEQGINHIDTARSYGEAELRIGPWMKHHRSSFFLASKTVARNKQGALEDLKQSLHRLQTDYLDLWQLHCLVNENEWETAMGKGGALEAAIEAKKQGLVRFLGVTGHGVGAPGAHLKSLQVYDFDSVLIPFNYAMLQNPAYKKDAEDLLLLCKQRNVAVQAIKCLARGEWGDKQKAFATWYDAISTEESVETAVHWVLAHEQLFLNSPGDVTLLPLVLKAARKPVKKPSEEQMQLLVRQESLRPLFV